MPLDELLYIPKSTAAAGVTGRNQIAFYVSWISASALKPLRLTLINSPAVYMSTQDPGTPLVHFLGIAARRAAAIYGHALHEITRQVRTTQQPQFLPQILGSDRASVRQHLPLGSIVALQVAEMRQVTKLRVCQRLYG